MVPSSLPSSLLLDAPLSFLPLSCHSHIPSSFTLFHHRFLFSLLHLPSHCCNSLNPPPTSDQPLASRPQTPPAVPEDRGNAAGRMRKQSNDTNNRKENVEKSLVCVNPQPHTVAALAIAFAPFVLVWCNNFSYRGRKLRSLGALSCSPPWLQSS